MNIKFHKNLIFNRGMNNIQIIQFTNNNPTNPYYTMLGDYLTSKGTDFKYCTQIQEIKDFINDQSTIIHLHQLSPYYHSKNRNETQIKARILLDQLKDFKIQGAKLVFTMHNPLPHNRIYRDIDENVNNEMYSMADAIIVHGQYAKDFLIKDQNEIKAIHVVIHPSYKEYYGTKWDKENARKELGLPIDAVIYGNIGNIKPYKGLEFIIEAFIKFSDQEKDKNIHLFLAGAANDKDYFESLKKITEETDNISVINSKLSDYELNKYISALDYSVFAFKDIWASGSVVLSISYEIPVIVPEIGCVTNYITHLHNGFLYHSNDLKSLINTFNLALKSDGYDDLQYKCNKFSQKYTISNFADQIMDIYKQVLK
jgi:beta-1,4-mannosyltransferase